MKLFQHDKYTIEIISENINNICFVVNDTINLKKYSNNITNSDIITNLTIHKFILVIEKCFDPKYNNYSCVIINNNTFLEIFFVVNFDDIIHITQKILLNEINYSKQQLELIEITGLKMKITDLESKINDLKEIMINIESKQQFESNEVIKVTEQ